MKLIPILGITPAWFDTLTLIDGNVLLKGDFITYSSLKGN